MRTGIIKKVVMTASLGLALLFSGQARADDLVFASCEIDADTGDLILGTVHTSSGAVLPKEVTERGSCLDAVKALKAAGCKKSALVEITEIIQTGPQKGLLHGFGTVRGLRMSFVVACPLTT